MEKEILLKQLNVATVRNLLESKPTVIAPDASIRDLLKKMNEDLTTRSIYVVDKANKLIGVIRMNTLVDFLFPMTAIINKSSNNLYHMENTNFQAGKVAEIMNESPFFVNDTTDLGTVASILMKNKINELPVIDENTKLIGIINFHEIIHAYLGKTEIK